MILLSASKVWLWVQRDGGLWSFLTWTKSLTASPIPGNESWGCGRDPSDSPRKSMLLSPWVGRCRTKVDVLRSWSPPRVWFIHLRLEKSFSFFIGKYHLFRIESFWVDFLMRPSFPTPQCLQPICHPFKFTPRTERIQGTIQVRLSVKIDGFWTGPSQK